MTTDQPGLFPEPARVGQQPGEPRFHILDAADAAAFDQTHAALTYGQFHSLADVRAAYDETRHWLFDSFADTLHRPGQWPDTEDVPGLTVHRHSLAQLGGAE